MVESCRAIRGRLAVVTNHDWARSVSRTTPDACIHEAERRTKKGESKPARGEGPQPYYSSQADSCNSGPAIATRVASSPDPNLPRGTLAQGSGRYLLIICHPRPVLQVLHTLVYLLYHAVLRADAADSQEFKPCSRTPTHPRGLVFTYSTRE